MSLRLVCLVALLGSSFWTGCGAEAEIQPSGPVARALADAAQAAQVPRDLLVAIAIEEGGLRLAPHRVYASEDHVPVAGYLELRHGAFDSLRRASELSGVSEAELVEDTVLATRAGAAVLAELRGDADAELASWEPALRTLSGFTDAASQQAYAQRVLVTLANGGQFRAYAGEVVVLPAHPTVAVLGVQRQAIDSTPQFPGATWTQTSCNGKCNVGRNPDIAVDTIVIHDTEGGWNASVATLQNDSGKSAHYLVDVDGSRVTQFRSEDDITWHAGNSNYNARSVGIEHIGYVDDPNGFADGLYQTSVQLVQSIRTRHTIPLDRTHIIGHYQVPDGTQIAMTSPPCAAPLLSCLNSTSYGGASNHTDPGPLWQWCQYMQRLGGSCTCNDANPTLTCTTDKTQAVRCQGGQVEIRTCQDPCVPQGSGVDDLCTAVAAPPKSKIPAALVRQRASRAPLITPTLDSPADAPATPVPVTAKGCDMGGAASSSSVWLPMWVVAALVLFRRRAS